MSGDEELAKQVNKGVAWAGASQAIIAIADLLSHVLVVALWISPEELGTMMAAMAFYPALDTAADLGVASALIQRDDHTPEKVSTVFWFNVVISLGLFLLLLVVGPLIGWLYGTAVIGTLIAVYGVKLLLQNAYAIPFALLRKQLRFADIAKLRTVAHLAESGGRIVYAALGLSVWTFTLAALTRVVTFAVLMQAFHRFRPRWVFRPREVGDFIRFGIRSSASQILYQLYTNIDYVIVTAFFGKTANGIYTMAYTIVLEPVRSITNVVSDVAFPTFARVRHDRRRVGEQLIKFTRLNLVAVLPFVVLILLDIEDFLLAFWGGQWTNAQLQMVADAAHILCFVGVLRALGFLGPPLLDGIGRPELTLRYMITAAIVNTTGYLLGAWLLGDRLGPLSVAVAWAVAYPLAFALLSYLVVRSTNLPTRRYVTQSWGIVACAALAYAVGIAIVLLGGGLPSWLRMLVVTAASMTVLAVLLSRWQGMSFRAIKAAVKGQPSPPPPENEAG